MLVAEGLHKTFGGTSVLSGVDLTVKKGRIIGLLGPSGAGKSTLFRILIGLDRPASGQVRFGDRDITGMGIEARSRLGIGYVPQDSALFADLTVEQNLRLALEARNSDPDRIDAIVDRVGRLFALDALFRSPVGTLSGGQRKLAEIAFGFCSFPRVLLVDEPFARLDPLTIELLCGHFRRLARSGIGILLTDHNAKIALGLVDEATVIYDGRVIARGDPASVADEPSVRSVFLGEAG